MALYRDTFLHTNKNAVRAFYEVKYVVVKGKRLLLLLPKTFAFQLIVYTDN